MALVDPISPLAIARTGIKPTPAANFIIQLRQPQIASQPDTLSGLSPQAPGECDAPGATPL